MWKEFKNFIMTGNVIDFAIAVILAGVVGGVVNGFVSDIASPIIGAVSKVPDLSQSMKIQLTDNTMGADGKEIPGATIMFGKWIASILNLLITGLVLFLIVKAKNRISPPPAPAPAGPSDLDLLAEIRDLLKK
jgi:large conductance mechanosensitive channel